YAGRITNQFPFLEIEIQNSKLKTQLIGKYNFENVMAAICVGKYFGVTDEKIKQAIESYSPSNNRSQILKQRTNTFILDAYNANPSRVNGALDNFISLPAENKIVILGDMAELGEAAHSEHQLIVRKLETVNFKLVCLVGNEFSKADASKKFLHFENVT